MDLDDDYSYDQDRPGRSTSYLGLFFQGVKSIQLGFFDQTLNLASIVDSLVMNSIQAVEGQGPDLDGNGVQFKTQDRSAPFSGLPFIGMVCSGTGCKAILISLSTFIVTLCVFSLITYACLRRRGRFIRWRDLYTIKGMTGHRNPFSGKDLMPSNDLTKPPKTVDLTTPPAAKAKEACLTPEQLQVPSTTPVDECFPTHGQPSAIRQNMDRGQGEVNWEKLSRNVSFCQEIETSASPAKPKTAKKKKLKQEKGTSAKKKSQPGQATSASAASTIKTTSKSRPPATSRVRNPKFSHLSPSPKTRDGGNNTRGRPQISRSRVQTKILNTSLKELSATPRAPSFPVSYVRSRVNVVSKSSTALDKRQLSTISLSKRPQAKRSQVSIKSKKRKTPVKKFADSRSDKSKIHPESSKMDWKNTTVNALQKSKDHSEVGKVTAKQTAANVNQKPHPSRSPHARQSKIRKPACATLKHIIEASNKARDDCRKVEIPKSLFSKGNKESKSEERLFIRGKLSENHRYPVTRPGAIVNNDASSVFPSQKQKPVEITWSSGLVRPVATREEAGDVGKFYPQSFRLRKTDTPDLKSLTGEGAFTSYTKADFLSDPWPMYQSKEDSHTDSKEDGRGNAAMLHGLGLTKGGGKSQVASENSPRQMYRFHQDHSHGRHKTCTGRNRPRKSAPLVADVNVNSWLGIWPGYGDGEKQATCNCFMNNSCEPHSCAQNEGRSMYCSKCNPLLMKRDNDNLLYFTANVQAHEKEREEQCEAKNKRSGRICLQPWPASHTSQYFTLPEHLHNCTRPQEEEKSIVDHFLSHSSKTKDSSREQNVQNAAAKNPSKSRTKHCRATEQSRVSRWSNYPENKEQITECPWDFTNVKAPSVGSDQNSSYSDSEKMKNRRIHRHKHCFAHAHRRRDYPYILNRREGKYRSRKENIIFSLASHPHLYKVKTHRHVLPCHRSNLCSSGRCRPHSGRSSRRDSEFSEDDVITLLENDLVRARTFPKQQFSSKEKAKERRYKPVTESSKGESLSLKYMLQELQDLANTKCRGSKSSKELYSQHGRRRSNGETRTMYSASDHSSAAPTRKRSRVEAGIGSHRHYHRCRRLRTHRHEPYKVDMVSSHSSTFAFSQRKLNKNNCSPGKENRYLLLPDKRLESEYPPELDLGQNPGYDSRYVIASDLPEMKFEMYHDPYGESPKSTATCIAGRERISRLLWPQSKRSLDGRRRLLKGADVKLDWRCHQRYSCSELQDGMKPRVPRELRYTKRSLKADLGHVQNSILVSLPLANEVDATSTATSGLSKPDRYSRGQSKIHTPSRQSARKRSNIPVFTYKSKLQLTESTADNVRPTGEEKSESSRPTPKGGKSESSGCVEPSSSKNVGVQTSPTLNSTNTDNKNPRRVKSRSILPKFICSKVYRPIRTRPFLRRQRTGVPQRLLTSRSGSQVLDSKNPAGPVLLGGNTCISSGDTLYHCDQQWKQDEPNRRSETSRQHVYAQKKETGSPLLSKATPPCIERVRRTEIPSGDSFAEKPSNGFSVTDKEATADGRRIPDVPKSIEETKTTADIDELPTLPLASDKDAKCRPAATVAFADEHITKEPSTVQAIKKSPIAGDNYSISTDKTYSIPNRSPTTYSIPKNVPHKFCESNTLPDQSGVAQASCLLRPMWQNADVNELDKRVRRALRLREELQLRKQNKQRATTAQILSHISQGYESSDTNGSTTNTEDLRPSDTDEIASSQLDATFTVQELNLPTMRRRETNSKSPTNASTVQNETDDLENTQPTCVQGKTATAILSDMAAPVSGDSLNAIVESFSLVASDSKEEVREDTRETAPVSFVDDEIDSRDAASQESYQQGRVSDIERRRRRVDGSSSLHAMLSQPETRRPERASSANTSSRPNNSNSDSNGLKRTGVKQKNSPPTKISKMDNVAATPVVGSRLVGELVQSLPYVPLSSFVEWFIETSDPRNFLDSDRSSGTSVKEDNETTGKQPPDHNPNAESRETSVMKSRFESPLDDKSCFKDSSKFLSAAYETPPHSKQNTTPFRGFRTTDVDSTLESFRFDSLSKPETPCLFATPSTPSRINSRVKRDGVFLKDSIKVEDSVPKKQVSKSKVRKIRDMMQTCVGSTLTPPSSSTHLHQRFASGKVVSPSRFLGKAEDWKPGFPSNNSVALVDKYDIAREKREGGVRRERAEAKRAVDTNRYSLTRALVQKAASSLESPRYDDNECSQKEIPHYSLGATEAPSCLKPTDSKMPLHAPCSNDMDILASFEEMTQNDPEIRPIAPVMQQLFQGAHLFLSPDGSIDREAADKCAPGIRQILMKLRNSKESVEQATVAQPDKMRITLRKSSDVTGIIAKFQGGGCKK